MTFRRRRRGSDEQSPGKTSQRSARETLGDLGLRPRRRWGQNFLVDLRVADRIVAAAEAAGREVLEIGPGLGALSDRLAAQAKALVLVEIDRTMSTRLRERFAEQGHVRVVEGDALEIDLAALFPENERAVVVANLPYSVASQILIRLLDERRRFSHLVLMLQREVAERLVARPGTRSYGVLSIWTALYASPAVLFHVSAGAFHPRPKVESTVVRLSLQDEPRVTIRDEEIFRAIVRASFGQRRKTLRHAVSAWPVEGALEYAGIDPRRRGETLDLEEFARLANVVAGGEK